MKKYIYASLFAVAAMLTATSCEEDCLGTIEGNDSKPSVLVYKYEVSSPNNPDNDTQIRFVANSAIESAYYLVEKTADAESHGLGTDAYADYVIANGTKLDVAAGKDEDLLLKDLYGPYTISAVGVKGSAKAISSQQFVGLDWETVCKGTFLNTLPNLAALYGAETIEDVELQVCTTDKYLYRLKDLFAKGYSIKLDLLPDYTATDEVGTYTYVRIRPQETGIVHPSHGMFSIRDIGYWQGSAAWITDNGYESGMYEGFFCFLRFQLYNTEGKNYGYNEYNLFIPAE